MKKLWRSAGELFLSVFKWNSESWRAGIRAGKETCRLCNEDCISDPSTKYGGKKAQKYHSDLSGVLPEGTG